MAVENKRHTRSAPQLKGREFISASLVGAPRGPTIKLSAPRLRDPKIQIRSGLRLLAFPLHVAPG